MSNRPPLNWGRVLADLKSDRQTRQPIREERLRAASMLRGSPALALSGWRGQSGRRYVVGIHPIAKFDPEDGCGAVVLFIARSDDGTARIVYGARDLEAHDLAGLRDLAAADGAGEVHVHRLADDIAERAAILDDLKAPSLVGAL